MTGQHGQLATRTVTGVVAAMVAGTAAATAVGFWLSYGGLHRFAVLSGLAGAEAWAWPASVDLFILVGEAGVTISALRRERDRAAWAYVALGLVASVTGNVLHVRPAALAWMPYAAAATPPLSALFALAALLRIIYRLAVARHEAAQLATAPKVATQRPAASTRKRPVARRGQARSAADTEAAALAALATDPGMTHKQLAAAIGTSERTARRVRARLATPDTATPAT